MKKKELCKFVHPEKSRARDKANNTMEKVSFVKLQEQVFHLLHHLFQDQEIYQTVDFHRVDFLDYQTVDELYAEIGYDLESEELLKTFNIQGTSDLQESLYEYSEYLYSDKKDKNFEEEWLKGGHNITDIKKSVIHLLFNLLIIRQGGYIIKEEVEDFFVYIKEVLDSASLLDSLKVDGSLELYYLLIGYNQHLHFEDDDKGAEEDSFMTPWL